MVAEAPASTLAARDAIRTVIYNYCRAIDRHDSELLASVYHAGATLDHGGPLLLAADFQKRVFENLAAAWRATQHFIGNVLIDVDGDTAGSEAYFIAHHRSRVPDSELPTLVALGGRYLDRFEKRDGDWRLVHRILVKDWQETRPYSDVRVKAYKVARTDRDDPSYGIFG